MQTDVKLDLFIFLGNTNIWNILKRLDYSNIIHAGYLPKCFLNPSVEIRLNHD